MEAKGEKGEAKAATCIYRGYEGSKCDPSEVTIGREAPLVIVVDEGCGYTAKHEI